MRLGPQTLNMLEDIPRKVIPRGDIVIANGDDCDIAHFLFQVRRNVVVAEIYMKPMICSLHWSFLPMKPIAAELLL